MKTSLATGLCLSVFLCVGRSSAEELQWRAAPSSSSSNNVTPSSYAAPPSGLPDTGYLNRPIPVTNGSDADFFHPAAPLVRAQNDEDARPAPGIGGTTPMPITGMPIVTDTLQSPQPKVIDNNRVKPVPMPSGETIPVPPTQIPQATPFIESLPMTADGCGCGITNLPIWGEAGGCGCGTSCGGGCTDGGCLSGCCTDGCCWNSNRSHLWLSADYLLWAFSKPNTPPLVTSGSAADAAKGFVPAALGAPSTQVLYGGNIFNTDPHSGARFTFGFWFPECCNWGAEFSGLYLGSNTTTYVSGGGLVGRPYTDVTPGLKNGPSAEPVNNYPQNLENIATALTNGNVRVDYTSMAWGVEANLLYKLCCGPDFRLNLLFGYRNFQLTEGISITENLNTTVTTDGGSSSFYSFINDRFSTSNSFNGAQVGLEGEWRFCRRFFLGGYLKVAVGNVNQNVNIAGVSNAMGGGLAGVFATGTNIGSYTRNQLGVLPEGCLKIGMDVTDHLRIYAGYNFLFLSDVTRPGDAIDTTLNVNNVQTYIPGAGPARPAFVFNNSTFWAQGLSVGLEYHY